jgi:hypothetical protein
MPACGTACANSACTASNPPMCSGTRVSVTRSTWVGKATYVRHFSRLLANLRANGLEAPVYVARASYCRGRTSEAVRAAQRAVVDARAGVLAGPDTDTLVGPGLRHDDCHFSAFGAALHAALWRDALLSAQR